MVTQNVWLGLIFGTTLPSKSFEVGWIMRRRRAKFFVQEFIPRGSLENHIFRRGSYFQPLSWNLRLKVALGAAKGLAFLHSPAVNIVHGNFKTSSILRHDNCPRMSQHMTSDNSHYICTWVTGINFFAAPEYIARGNVYSFGVVLLEMLSGRRVLDRNRPINEIRLLEWPIPIWLIKERFLVS